MASALQMIDTTKNNRMLFNEPMSKHTSWHVGGRAKQYYRADNIDDLALMLQSLPDNEPLFWLGLGSNTLVRDGGFDGVVVAMQGVATELEFCGDGDINVGASVTCAKLAKFCAKHHLQGGEFFAGIPGLVGGAIAMNAGAFGGETWRHVSSVKTINRQGEINHRLAKDFDVAYRTVNGAVNEWFVSAVMHFDKTSDESGIKNIKQLLAQRAKSQPTGVFSCGSVFKNPDGYYAAQLIEACGLKGKRIGGAIVSEKHANFILNDQSATADDIESLILSVQETVLEKHGVALKTEVKIIGQHQKSELTDE